MTNGNDLAYPHLTKREYFAGLAMQGMLANPYFVEYQDEAYIQKVSIINADALITELNNKNNSLIKKTKQT